MKRSTVLAPTLLVIALTGCGGSQSGSTTMSHTTVASSAGSAVTSPSVGTTAKPQAPTPTVGTAPAAPAQESTAGKTTPSERVKPEEEVGGTPFLAASGKGFGAFHAYVSKPLRRGRLVGGADPPAMLLAESGARYAAGEVAAAARAVGHEAALRSLEGPLSRLASNLSGSAHRCTPGTRLKRRS